jgi:hypothetical protein
MTARQAAQAGAAGGAAGAEKEGEVDDEIPELEENFDEEEGKKAAQLEELE